MATTKEIILDDTWQQLNTVDSAYLIQVKSSMYDVEIQYNTATPTTNDSILLSTRDVITSSVVVGIAYGRRKPKTQDNPVISVVE
jgi:hypothetical protein